MRLQKWAYDVCIVIPAYAEGLDIVPALRSIAYQVRRIVVWIRVAVIVVVNNRPKPPKDVFDSNVDTYNFLRSISSSKSKRLSLTQNYVHKVWIQVAAINRFSSRNAIRDCNVGRARREWFSEAVRACKDEGIIIGTDADTRLAHTYIKQALTLRDWGNFVATWPVTVLDGHQSSEVEKIIFIARAYEHLLQFDSYQSWQSWSRNHIPHLSGSNMVFSRSAYLDTDGIDNLPWAEDVRLGMKMSAKGHTIIHNDNLQVFTDPRPSFRAPLGHSFGQAQHQYREGAKNPAYPFLPSRAFVRATKWIIPTFESLRNRDVCDKKTFYSVLQREFRTMGIQIKQERMKIWWNKFELCRKFPGSMFDPFISVDVMDLIRESKPNVSPIDAFRELSAWFSELQDKAFLEDLVRYTGLGWLHYCFFSFIWVICVLDFMRIKNLTKINALIFLVQKVLKP